METWLEVPVDGLDTAATTKYLEVDEMDLKKRVALAAIIGGTISLLGFIFSLSAIGVLRAVGLTLNWHLAVVLSQIFPGVNWELGMMGVVVLALVLPTVEWILIAFGALSVGSRSALRAP